MGIFDIFKKKKKEKTEVKSKPEEKIKPEVKEKPLDLARDKPVKPVKKVEKPVVKPEVKAGEIKGKSQQAYRVLVKPLITEKASDLGPLNKYVFAVNPRINKVEVKKAIRTIYNVEPIKVNISNFSGKSVRYGRIRGKTKSWKKAVVTLKEGDKIEVYEGV